MSTVTALPRPRDVDPTTVLPKRPVVAAMRRGALFRCPRCGKGTLYRAYLKVNAHCPSCGEALHHERADDAPPYMTIFAVGHIMIPLVLGVDMIYEWPMWLNMVVWLPSIAALALVVLPVMKGALVGLQWALRMHGFGADATTPRPAAADDPRSAS